MLLRSKVNGQLYAPSDILMKYHAHQFDIIEEGENDHAENEAEREVLEEEEVDPLDEGEDTGDATDVKKRGRR